MDGPSLDGEQLRVIRDYPLLHGLLSIIRRLLEWRVPRGQVPVEAKPPPGPHSGVTRRFERTEKRAALINEFEIFGHFAP